MYKKPIVRLDPATGDKIRSKSRKWWGRYRDADGRERRVPLAADKAAAQAMLHEIVRRVEREAAGIVDPFEKHRKRPLATHISDWKSHRFNKGNTEKYVNEVVFKVNRIVGAWRCKVIGDLAASDVGTMLGRPSRRRIEHTDEQPSPARCQTIWTLVGARPPDER